MNSIDRYAVIGSGIGHSRSPQIHALFAQATRQAMEYGLLDVPPVAFETVVRNFFRDGGRGLNVTVPHKEAALRLADTLTPRATARRRGEHAGRSALTASCSATTPTALVWCATSPSTSAARSRGARVLLLGAGGAARGVIAPLLEAGVAALVISNRHGARAKQLAQEFADLGPITAAASRDCREPRPRRA